MLICVRTCLPASVCQSYDNIFVTCFFSSTCLPKEGEKSAWFEGAMCNIFASCSTNWQPNEEGRIFDSFWVRTLILGNVVVAGLCVICKITLESTCSQNTIEMY